ncbi:TPA: hypothetical protein N0F65_005000 [Lagenidium giganteum]|uniref:Reverse transcriptase n=1 Tax=Lagenidium giganteum TaxID=4803 RepID=A0AAV2ZR64_9STRA|nr:TPA: hypothetical protein N0F65_005000 [Lagenidium giganteum]
MAIHEDEVIGTLKRCKRGKACGPDGLSNDFYRDQAAVIVPLLTHLFNTSYEHGVVPGTFSKTDIFCK